MIGKIISFISGAFTGFLIGTLFGTAIGRKLFTKAIELIQTKLQGGV